LRVEGSEVRVQGSGFGVTDLRGGR